MLPLSCTVNTNNNNTLLLLMNTNNNNKWPPPRQFERNHVITNFKLLRSFGNFKLSSVVLREGEKGNFPPFPTTLFILVPY